MAASRASDKISRMRIACCLFTALIAAGCGPSAIDGGFDSPNPAARMYAIESAARSGDVGAVRRIVEQLDSDDPAVRLLAIGALERLTGRTHGYCHADTSEQREIAIVRWEQSISDGLPARSVLHVEGSADDRSAGASDG